MNEENKKLESFLKKSYEGFDQEPSDLVWKGLEERMDEDKKDRPFWWIWLRNAFAILFLITISGLGYYFISKNSDTKVADSEVSNSKSNLVQETEIQKTKKEEQPAFIDQNKSLPIVNSKKNSIQKQKKDVQKITEKTKNSINSKRVSGTRARPSVPKKAVQKNENSVQSSPQLISNSNPILSNPITSPVFQKESTEVKSSVYNFDINQIESSTSSNESYVISAPIKSQNLIDLEKAKMKSSENILSLSIKGNNGSKEINEKEIDPIFNQNVRSNEKLNGSENSEKGEVLEKENEEEKKFILKVEFDKDDEENFEKKESITDVTKENEVRLNLNIGSTVDSLSISSKKANEKIRLSYKCGLSLRSATTLVEIDNHVEAGIAIGLHQEFIKNRWSVVNKTHLNAHGYSLDKDADSDGLTNEALTRYPHFFTEDNEINGVAATSFFFDNSLGLSYLFIKRNKVNVSFTPSIVWQLYLPQTFHYDFTDEDVVSLRSNVYLLSLGSVQGSLDFKYITKKSRHIHTSFWLEKSLIPLGIDNRNTFLGGLQISYLFGKRKK